MDTAYTWHKVVYNLARVPMYITSKLKFGFHTEKPLKLQNPYIVVSNHTTYWDQFFVGLSFSKHMYFLASEHSFRMGLVSFIMRSFAAPIGRVKGSTDASAALSIIRRVRKGRNICFFPEGERSFDGRTADLHPTAAKLLRTAGVPVVTYRLRGGYLTDPRWAKHRRRGRVRGSVVRIYTPEELKRMSVGEIHDAILSDIYEDAWETQRSEKLIYRGKKLAEGLEEALFICPKCGGTDTMTGRGNVFSCSCGMTAEMDETGFFKEGAPFETVAAWDDWQRDELAGRLAEDSFRFSDEGAWLARLGDKHDLNRVAEGTITLTRCGLTVGGQTFALDEMSDCALCHGKRSETIMFTSGGAHYELGFSGSASRRKYALALKALRAAAKNV